MLTASDEIRTFEYLIPLAGGRSVAVATVLPERWRPVLHLHGMAARSVDAAAVPLLEAGYRAYRDYARRALAGEVPPVADPEADGLVPADYRGRATGAFWSIGFVIHQAELIEVAVMASQTAGGDHAA